MSTTAIRNRTWDRIAGDMLNIDPAKLLIIAVVAVILLGPDRLPQVARQIGGVWRSFNDYRHRMESQVRSSMPDLPSTSDIARLARSPSALLNHLSNMDSPAAATEPDTGGPDVTVGETVESPVAAEPDPTPVPLHRPPVVRTPVAPPETVRQTDPSMN
jgi:Sec-independent protein translocase protein TatA